MDQNGVLGDPCSATAEADKKYLEDIIAFLYRWVGKQDKG
jgi:creatinine amidohydrolase/Fe(II)-dependent formamide hydrolase-like protein